jgi:uncharacterized protein YndB with AHSA1/START domain
MGRTDTASRTIVAPPERVYAALVDHEARTVWLPPDGMRGSFERFDARPGGSYRMILTYTEASGATGKATADSDVVEVRFVDLIPGVRVVEAVDFVSDDPAYAGTMTMTWPLTAVDAGTRVEIRAEDVPPGITAEDHAVGLASSLAKLDASSVRAFLDLAELPGGRGRLQLCRPRRARRQTTAWFATGWCVAVPQQLSRWSVRRPQMTLAVRRWGTHRSAR